MTFLESLLLRPEAASGTSQARTVVAHMPHDKLGAACEQLERMHGEYAIGIDAYYELQEEVDWRELTLLRSEDSRIEEI